jgi:serine/threonine protein kinase
MTDRPRNRIEHLFSEALMKPSKRMRSEFLAESCGGDVAVRSRLEELLTAHERAGSFLETPITDLEEWGFVLNEEFTRHPGERRPFGADALSFLDPPQRPDEIGSFGEYGVTRLLGRGGAGIVLKAHDRRLNRLVALKVLAPEWAAQAHARQRFLREARAAAAVRHEHVVAIHAIDETAVLPFLVMEYVPGESLQERISRDGALEIGEVLRIGREVAAGLAAAHAQRLVHRDVKPANILLEEGTGRARITDFGLARTVDDVGITQEGMIAGTPQYMSPEQAKGNAIDFRSDLFSFGSVLYAMCTGRPPFQADNNLAVMRKICEEAPRPLGELRPEMPPDFVQLIDDLLAKDAACRPQTAEHVAARLEQMARGGAPVAAVRALSRRRLIVGGSIGAVAVAAAMVAFGPWNSEEANDSPSPGPESSSPTPDAPRKTNRKLNAALFDESVEPLTEFRRMTVPGQRIDSLAVSPDGLRIYAGASDGVIYVWDARTGEEVQRYPGHKPVTTRILLSRDGARMVTFGADRAMRVWNTKSGGESLHVPMLIPFRDAALSPDGGEVVVSFYGGRAGAGIIKRLKRPAGAIGSSPPRRRIPTISSTGRPTAGSSPLAPKTAGCCCSMPGVEPSGRNAMSPVRPVPPTACIFHGTADDCSPPAAGTSSGGGSFLSSRWNCDADFNTASCGSPSATTIAGWVSADGLKSGCWHSTMGPATTRR